MSGRIVFRAGDRRIGGEPVWRQAEAPVVIKMPEGMVGQALAQLRRYSGSRHLPVLVVRSHHQPDS